MSMPLALPELISAETLAQIHDILDASKFVDGRVTADRGTDKSNLEMAPDERYVEVTKIVDLALRASEPVRYAVFPRYMSRPIVSRYDPGMFFAEHTDAAIMGLTGSRKGSMQWAMQRRSLPAYLQLQATVD